jgi:hypothetical protein
LRHGHGQGLVSRLTKNLKYLTAQRRMIIIETVGRIADHRKAPMINATHFWPRLRTAIQRNAGIDASFLGSGPFSLCGVWGSGTLGRKAAG